MRLIGAIFRALVIVALVAAPSLILPSASQSGLEFALIIGGIIGAFTLFEYGSGTPGFVDFRFAPPYNRFRVFTIAMQILFISLMVRAYELSIGDFRIVDWAAKLTVWLDFPYSPLTWALDLVLERSDVTGDVLQLLAFSSALSLFFGIGATIVFIVVLWVFDWPRDREHFNLWANLPTFQPSDPKRAVRRLRRDAIVNAILAVVFLYGSPYALVAGFDWFSPALLENHQAQIWIVTLWCFLPATLLARAGALLKIVRILSRVYSI